MRRSFLAVARAVLLLGTVLLSVKASAVTAQAKIPSESEYKEYIENHFGVFNDSKNGFRIVYTGEGAERSSRIEIERISDRQRETMDKAISIVKRATGAPHEKVRFFHDEICRMFSYQINHDLDCSDCIGGFTTGLAKCVGYADAFMLLCDLADIPCYAVVGASDIHAPTGHRWNIVQLEDGEWYEVDVTGDDSESRLTRFLITTEEMSKTYQRASFFFYDGEDIYGNSYAQGTLPIAKGTKFRPVIPVTKVEIVGGSRFVSVQDSIRLFAALTPDYATDGSIRWTTSDKSVATVKNSGTVEKGDTDIIPDAGSALVSKAEVVFKNPGTVTITAAAADGSGIKDSIKIEVQGVNATKIKVSGEKVVRAGSSIQLVSTVYPKLGTSKKVKWTSSNKSVATVNSKGKVTAKKAGKVTITAAAADGSGVQGSYKVTVIKKDADPAASKIVKKAASVKLKAQGSKKVKVSWKDQGDAIRYEIALATDKKFTKNVVTKTAEKGKASLSVKYKKTGTVYVRVRAVDKYGYVGKWSDVKKVKIK